MSKRRPHQHDNTTSYKKQKPNTTTTTSSKTISNITTTSSSSTTTTTTTTATAATTAATAATYLLDNEITIHEANTPPPCLELSKAPFPKQLIHLLLRQGFTVPSPVQASTWPIAVTGRDVLAIAKTGSGKTLGFLLPVLTRCYQEKSLSQGNPSALIMAPTRELALQIHAESMKFGKTLGLRSVAVYGGAKVSVSENVVIVSTMKYLYYTTCSSQSYIY